jgi:hypothetical protein
MSSSTFPPGDALIQGYQLRNIVIGTLVKKGPLTLPQSATSTLFTITGGAVLVTGLMGLVTTAIGATATNLSTGCVPATGTAESSGIANATAITSLAAGTWIHAPINGSSTITAPSFPTTGTPVTNNNAFAVSAVISLNGATISNVSVNGVTAGAGAGTYVVPAHGTISVAYTVATPTWTWANAKTLAIGAGGGQSILGQHTGLAGAFVVPAGTITWTTSASDTGAITWYLHYVQLDSQPGVGIGSAQTAMVA